MIETNGQSVPVMYLTRGYVNYDEHINVFHYYIYLHFLSWRDSPLVGLGLLLIHEDFCGFLITHNDTPHSVGFLWTRDQLVAETST